jgi:DNA-binding CsgD family transcriptional regulator
MRSGYGAMRSGVKSNNEFGQWSSPEELAKLRAGETTSVSVERCAPGVGVRTYCSPAFHRPRGERVNLKHFYDISERKQGEKQLMDALQRVMSDTSWFAQKVMHELAEVRIGDKEPGLAIQLSKREREVLERLARGTSNDAIAAELGIATQTIRNYISAIYDKLGVNSRAEAIVWARERGIV